MDLPAKHHWSLVLQNLIEIKAAALKLALQDTEGRTGLQGQSVGYKEEDEQGARRTAETWGPLLKTSKSPANNTCNALMSVFPVEKK